MAEAKAELEVEAPKMKPRPIVRLGIFLISHSLLVSVVCCTAGVLALLLLPVLAKNTYISENALMPGSASSMISNHDVSEANKLADELSRVKNLEFEDEAIERRRILLKYMSDLGAEVSYHKFHPQLNHFNPLHFFSGPDSRTILENSSCSTYGINTIGIIRAPRGDGKESIVLVTPYNYRNSDLGENLSLSIAYAVFSLLTRVTWLAKDIIWLIADSQYGEYAPVAAWLRDYHTPVFTALGIINADSCSKDHTVYVLKEELFAERKISDSFRRAGTMAAALILKSANRNEPSNTLRIYAEASNGQMPNLDLINIVNYLAVHRQGFNVQVEKFWSFLDSKCLKLLGEIFELVGKVARSLNPGWKFGIPTAEYVEGAATLASSLYSQALGIPTGPHGAFRDFQVDAITLEISPNVGSIKRASYNNDLLLQGGRLLEGVIRSVNNLLEKFHQSFFLYLLTSPSKFVSVGVYMIAFALLVAPLPLVAASLYSDSDRMNGVKNGKSTTVSSDEFSITFQSWKWLNAVKQVFLVHVWGAAMLLLPYFIGHIPSCNAGTSFILWVFLSMLSLLILYFLLGSPFFHAELNREWTILKSAAISAVFIGLLLMSVVNFATAEIGAFILVPTCLIAHPLKLDAEAANLRSFFRILCNLVMLFIAFPPTAFFLWKGIFQGFDSIDDVGDIWNWMESLWAWNSATYIYIGMVHMPCWVLCMHILLHSC